MSAARTPGEAGQERLVEAVRTMASPTLLIRPVRSISPDWYFFGVRPKWAPTAFDLANRPGWSMADLKVMATTAPTPGTVINRPHTSSSRTAASSCRCKARYSAPSAARARSKGSATCSSMAWPATNSRMRASNLPLLIAPTFNPKPRRMPRMLLSTSRSLAHQ